MRGFPGGPGGNGALRRRILCITTRRINAMRQALASRGDGMADISNSLRLRDDIYVTGVLSRDGSIAKMMRETLPEGDDWHFSNIQTRI